MKYVTYKTREEEAAGEAEKLAAMKLQPDGGSMQILVRLREMKSGKGCPRFRLTDEELLSVPILGTDEALGWLNVHEMNRLTDLLHCAHRKMEAVLSTSRGARRRMHKWDFEMLERLPYHAPTDAEQL